AFGSRISHSTPLRKRSTARLASTRARRSPRAKRFSNTPSTVEDDSPSCQWTWECISNCSDVFPMPDLPRPLLGKEGRFVRIPPPFQGGGQGEVGSAVGW